MKTLAALILLGVLAPTAASAQTAPPLAAAAFERADLNNDARLSPAEFNAAREALFARADANGDGRLTLPEARSLRPSGGGMRRPGREAIQALRAVDRNNDRAIDLGEFRAVGPARFANADLDRNGYISRGEIAAFARAMGMAG